MRFSCLPIFLLISLPIAARSYHIAVYQGREDSAYLQQLGDRLSAHFAAQGHELIIHPYVAAMDGQTLQQITAQLAQQPLDLVISHSPQVSEALLAVLPTYLPVIINQVQYPDDLGLIATQLASLNNVTGTVTEVTAADYLASIQTALPRPKQIAFVYAHNNNDAHLQALHLKRYLRQLAIEFVPLRVTDLADLQQHAEALQQAHAIITANDAAFATQVQPWLWQFAQQHSLVLLSHNSANHHATLALHDDTNSQINAIVELAAAILIAHIHPKELPLAQLPAPTLLSNRQHLVELGQIRAAMVTW